MDVLAKNVSIGMKHAARRIAVFNTASIFSRGGYNHRKGHQK